MTENESSRRHGRRRGRTLASGATSNGANDRTLALDYITEFAAARRQKPIFEFNANYVRDAKILCRELIEVLFAEGFVDIAFDIADSISWFRYFPEDSARMVQEVFDCQASPLGGSCFHWPDPEPVSETSPTAGE